jgi:hypothetical protein
MFNNRMGFLYNRQATHRWSGFRLSLVRYCENTRAQSVFMSIRCQPSRRQCPCRACRRCSCDHRRTPVLRPCGGQACRADGLAFLVIDEKHLGLPNQHGLAVLQLKLGHDAGADHLFWRNTVGCLGPGAHELDPATGDDISFETIGPQIGEQFLHRLIRQLRVLLLQLGMFGRPDPVRDDPGELVDGHAGMRDHDDFHDAFHAGRGDGLHVALQRCLENGIVLPFWMVGGHFLQPVQGEGHLCVNRCLVYRL